MTHEEIIKKAQEKAIANGYKGYTMPTATADHEQDVAKAALLTKLMQRDFAPIMIFSHDFAKAIWGSELLFSNPNGKGYVGAKGMCLGVAWYYHLQKMVIEQDPIKYLEQFL